MNIIACACIVWPLKLQNISDDGATISYQSVTAEFRPAQFLIPCRPVNIDPVFCFEANTWIVSGTSKTTQVYDPVTLKPSGRRVATKLPCDCQDGVISKDKAYCKVIRGPNFAIQPDLAICEAVDESSTSKVRIK